MGNLAEVQKSLTSKEAGEQWYELRDRLWWERQRNNRSQQGIPVNQMASVLLRFRHGPEFDILLNQCWHEESQRSSRGIEKSFDDISLTEQRKVTYWYVIDWIRQHLIVDPSYYRNAGLLQYGKPLL
ncbi:hypothetical protein A4U49_04325 [Acidithiobacillus ferrivorans]|jgi:hypothetical protein|uniref:hypothetical protein n=1 Tax=Acidithiobacillus ferrivorans TaxID=160808 RepID=UPI000893FEA4|nr:hypothetical protein [Acidithiobacillus ferrivorans]OFA17013.1 hypothetical protein A4U49_04325 [Acidithiobacillus ferrivorans]